MKNIRNVKITIIAGAICIIMIVSSVSGINTNGFTNSENNSLIQNIENSQINNGKEYWALLFAVGIYKNHPEKDRESMLVEVEDFYETLIGAPEWQADHIHKVTGADATGIRLIKELLWLIQSGDNDDTCLIYIATHGSPLTGLSGAGLDLPPFDEADGADEILVMYDGFDKWYGFIWDDLLNFFISRLQSEAVCLVVDSCYAGGFNDYQIFSKTTQKKYSAELFTQGLMEDLSSQGRVVLMACQEHETSYGSYFSDYLISGLGGLADLVGNTDGVNSAEEAFNFAKFWVEFLHSFHPTILDLYPPSNPAGGELGLTTWAVE